MVAQRGQLLIGGQSSQVLQTLLGRRQTFSGRRLDEPGEDRLQSPLREHVQNLDSKREEEENASGLIT